MVNMLTRRGFMGHTAGAFAATAIVGGTAVAVSDLKNLRLMEAYNEWLFVERRLLMREAFPDCDSSFVHCSTAARTFHLPMGQDWKNLPQPSTRAGLILGTVGVSVDDEGV